MQIESSGRAANSATTKAWSKLAFRADNENLEDTGGQWCRRSVRNDILVLAQARRDAAEIAAGRKSIDEAGRLVDVTRTLALPEERSTEATEDTTSSQNGGRLYLECLTTERTSFFGL
jgi:hypothetical protein